MTRACTVLMMLALAACSSSKPAQREPPPAKDRAEAYYPLKVGNRWTYDELAMGKVHNTWASTITQQLSPSQFVMEVTPLGANAGPAAKPARMTLEVRPRGIFDGARYLLEEPVTPGKKWMAVMDVRTAEKFEVVTTAQRADVAAGRFEGCALVRNTIQEPGEVTQLTEVTFCPDVGMVESRIRILKPGKPEIPVSHMMLTTFESGGARVLPRTFGN